LAVLLLASASAHGSVFARLRGGKAAYKLTYFDARGVAELSRIALVAAGVDFEDARFPISMEGGKPSVPEFTAAKASGALTVNMDRVPILEIPGGPTIGQSRTIERFVARRHALYGADEMEAALVDMVVEHSRDIKEAFGRAVPPFGPESEEKAAKRDAWYAEALGDWLQRLERALPPSDNDAYAVGAVLSLADLAIWQLLRDTFSDAERARKAAASCTRLNAIADQVAAMPAVAGWLANRPQTMM